MNDQQTRVSDIRRLVREFVDQRDWRQFHTPKNISMALAIEAAELMEHFQWLTADQSRAVAGDPRRLASVGEELADVLCYPMALANELNLDVASAIEHKMAANREKYPVERFRGRYGPEDHTDRDSTDAATPEDEDS